MCCEKGSDAVRTNFAAHMYAPLRAARAPPALIAPVVQVFGGAVYMHQFNDQRKMAFDGGRLAVAPGLRHLATDDLMPRRGR